MPVAFPQKDDGSDTDITNPNPGAEVDYSLLVQTTSGFETILLEANVDKLIHSPSSSNFPMTTTPDLNFKDGTVFSFYKQNGNCIATFLQFDFENEAISESNEIISTDLEL